MASSSLPVGCTAGGSCSVTGGGSVHITGAGNCQITVSQPGNINYNAAPNVVQSFSISIAAVTATGGGGTGGGSTVQYDGTVKTPSAYAVTGSFTGDLICTN